eukprot:COSAG01_NODE_795_length_13541_cov_5.530725_9_plen_315_part_00
MLLLAPVSSVASQLWEPIHERVLGTIIHAAPPTAGQQEGRGAAVTQQQRRRTDWAAQASTIIQPRDHFAPLDSATWKMRYWVDDSCWSGRSSSPVFLSMGGEGGQGPPGGAVKQWAQAHGALMFSIEHRYYGQSIPTPDFSTANLRWLSTEQALADAAWFVRRMQLQYNLTTEAKWISVGGSCKCTRRHQPLSFYSPTLEQSDCGSQDDHPACVPVVVWRISDSGELAAWVRLKYPHLIFGAVASSAPVSAIVDYDGYDPIVAKALAYPLVGGSPACRAAVAEAFDQLQVVFGESKRLVVESPWSQFTSECQRL